MKLVEKLINQMGNKLFSVNETEVYQQNTPPFIFILLQNNDILCVQNCSSKHVN